jgi:flagellar basal body-associated protein FliL
MDETPNQEVTAGQGPGNKWRTVVVAAALLIASGTAAACFLFHRPASGAENKAKAEPKAKYVMHLDPFVVNLAEAEGDRFLRMGIELGLDREAEEHGHPAQAAMSLARTRDTILSILTPCNAGALVPSNGKAILKERLATALRERAPELGVREIYFTEFLVQR